FRPSARTGRVDNAGYVLAASWSKSRLDVIARLRPAHRSLKIRTLWRLCHENDRDLSGLETHNQRERSPERVFNKQDLGFGVSEQKNFFLCSELVIQRNQYSATIENRVGANQPLGLVRHDDGRSIILFKTGLLQRVSQGKSLSFEIRICQPAVFSVSIRLDQSLVVLPTINGVAERLTQALVSREVGSDPFHQRRE